MILANKDKLPSTGILNQLLLYVPARVIPGLVNFIALGIYTRWLSEANYGRYALVLAVADLVQVAFFYGLRLGLFRYFQNAKREDTLSTLISTSFALLILTSGLVSILWVGSLLLLPLSDPIRSVMWWGLPLLLSQSLLAHFLELNQANLTPRRYGALAAGRALLSLAIAFILISQFGLGEQGVLIGLTIGTLVPCVFDLPQWIKYFSFKNISWPVSRSLFVYGLPLMVTFLLKFVVSTSDRFLIEYFLGSQDVGRYVVGYDLTDQTLSLLFLVVNLAGFPIVLKALEESGVESARSQLHQYALILLGLTIPACTGLALLARPVAMVIVGERFQDITTFIIPFIALSAFIAGLKAFYFDLAFQLGLRTELQIWPVAVGAVVNFLLNLVMIPSIGLMGAVYATIAAFLVSLIMSFLMGRSVFDLPLPFTEIAKIIIATAFMALSIQFLPPYTNNFIYLLIGLVVGAFSYMLLITALNVGGIRHKIMQRWGVGNAS